MKLVVSSLLVAFASSALAAAAPAGADPAPAPAKVEAPSVEKLDLARRFVSLAIPADRFMEMTRAGYLATAEAGIAQIEDAAAQAEAQKDVNSLYARMEPKMRERLPALLEAYAQSYARGYSVDELKQLIVFAGSPVGQHYLSRQDDDDDGVREATKALWDATESTVDEFRKEKCAAKAAQRVAMGDKKAKCPLSSAPETLAG